MDPSERAAFAAAVRGVAERHWASATEARSGDLLQLWKAAAAQGWFDVGGEDEFGALLAGVRELGRLACPLPLVDGFVATRLLLGRNDLLASIGDGSLRVLIVDADQPRPLVDCGEVATHVLAIPVGGGTASLRPIISATSAPGLAVPSWSFLTIGSDEAEIPVTRDEVNESLVMLRLGLAVRALAAAERSHEMAIEHAKVRVQFGRPIGSFGAVQQRSASCQIDITAASLLVAEAARSYGAGAHTWPLAAAIAAEFIRSTAPRTQLGAHHTLAAVGYFEEHEAPWLFRRVHADVVRMQDYRPSSGEVADRLIESDTSLPPINENESGRAFRRELRDFFAEHAEAGPDGLATYNTEHVVAAMAARGWWGFGWPESAGGRSAPLAEQVILAEEIEYGRVPATLAVASVMLLGDSILRHGTDEQKERFLPLIRSGGVRFCLGYSEPEAGSDLASLTTRAERDGDEWVINGQKLWSTGGHVASHVWLAVRTDPQAVPRHAGISVFLVPMDTPGITVRPHTALSGGISCTVFYDDVRVPHSALVGEVNGGWKVITDALVGERVVMGGISASVLRQLDDLLDVIRRSPDEAVGPRGSAKRARLGQLAVTLQATRALVSAATGATNSGSGVNLLAPMAAVLGGELAEDFGEAALELLGPAAGLSAGTLGALGGGEFEYGLRLSIMYVVGGGTNDVQRGLIARSLGLPR